MLINSSGLTQYAPDDYDDESDTYYPDDDDTSREYPEGY